MADPTSGAFPAIRRAVPLGVLLAALLGLTACDAGPGGDPWPAEGSSPAVAASTTPEQADDLAPAEALRVYVTGYSFFDNTPPGSVRISHPVLHTTAGGTGTYDDPTTVAVGHVISADDDILDWPAGTRFYLPNLRKYFIVEDTCGDGDSPQDGPCHTGYPAGTSAWLDLWIGGEGGDESETEECMRAISGTWDVIVAPRAGYATQPGEIYEVTGCAEQYGDELVRGSA